MPSQGKFFTGFHTDFSLFWKNPILIGVLSKNFDLKSDFDIPNISQKVCYSESF